MQVSHFAFTGRSQPSYPEHSSVQPIISLAGVWPAAQRNLTDATARSVVNPTQELPAQNFPCSTDEKQLEVKLKKLFVPLPNSISTPVNVENLTAEFQDYPFPDIKHYCLTKISVWAKRSISRVFSLFIVPSPFFVHCPYKGRINRAESVLTGPKPY